MSFPEEAAEQLRSPAGADRPGSGTVKSIHDCIDIRQRQLKQHPLLAAIQPPTPAEKALVFAPSLGFWVMAFQDLLHLNATRTRDPALRALAENHRREDAGHDVWFWHDLAELGFVCSATSLFAPDAAATRQASYRLIGEVLTIADDRLRLVLLLAIEAAGDVFFDHVAGYVDKIGYGTRLQYFSTYHRQVEQKHELVGEEVAGRLGDLPDGVLQSGVPLVERVFDAFEEMFDEWHRRIVACGSDSHV